MKFQPKRFVVEVKRGTSRAAFASPDPASDRFSSAEALLFGGTTKSDVKTDLSSPSKGDASGGRVLRSLVEPPAPVAEEPAPPVRRGRKPGSKNKPKMQVATADTEIVAERPRRGRKPGSKNKPKPPVMTTAPSTVGQASSSLADVMRSYGFADDVAEPHDDEARHLPDPGEAAAIAAEDGDKPRIGRARLRDRSVILKRYVLDIEPRPGQPGAMRARRLARAARA